MPPNKAIRIAALTSGKNIPSARFRLRQYIPELGKQGVEVAEYCPRISQHARLFGRLGDIRTRYIPPVVGAQMLLNTMCRIPGIIGTHKADVMWLERCFVPGVEPLVCFTKAPRILDVDDAVWLMNLFGERSARFLARSVDAVIAGNSYVADWYSNYCKKVYVVPTAVDSRRFVPKKNGPQAERDEFVIGWTGTSGNFPHLQYIEESLARFMKAHRQARLLIVADRKPAFKLIPESQVIFEPWSSQAEASILHRMDVGIMPLADNQWTRGKCSFKMLQYMSAGIPVVVSNVGMNVEILRKGVCGFGTKDEDAWCECFEELYGQPGLRREMGQTGRGIVESFYSVEVVAVKLAQIFRHFA